MEVDLLQLKSKIKNKIASAILYKRISSKAKTKKNDDVGKFLVSFFNFN